MTMPEKLNADNAEVIGRPIFDNIMQSFSNEDRTALIQHFPYLNDWMTADIFNETVGVLNRLGELLSSEYSSYSVKDDKHLLMWNVAYKNDKNIVRWSLYLVDSFDGIWVNGFAFDR